ncbi:hypothetical protein ASG07_01640 [Sphingomonas sp. Leaf343]|nr:hypothetical protein ASG07_01640 [Sphingomonas sp. Leaf343]
MLNAPASIPVPPVADVDGTAAVVFPLELPTRLDDSIDVLEAKGKSSSAVMPHRQSTKWRADARR